MQCTAKACIKVMSQLRQHDKQARDDKANNTRQKQTFKVGDKVSFFIPPTASEAKRRGRKVKHITHYRGPATITNVRTPTTYDIVHNGKKYARATAELRPYRAKGSTTQNATATRPEQGEIKPGEWVAYRDNLEDDKFHIGKVASTGDFVTLEAWATTAKQLN